MLDTPILFLVFNRPDATAQVFEKIRAIKPKKLYIAADGPRAINKENEKCEQVKNIILNGIDWNCDVKTLFREKNIGCGKAVSGAISWFFENEEMGIILEDDCVPDASFFSFCENLLHYYRYEERVMHIGGTNSQHGKKTNNYSYYFSKYPHIWGWASWRRAWQKYNFSFSDADEQKLDAVFNAYNCSKKEIEYWKKHWNMINGENKIDTWDIQWTFSCWMNNGVTIVPNTNLISNIGFNADATHTTSETSILANLPLAKIGNILHPNIIAIDKKADDYTFRKYNLMEQPSSIKIKNWISEKIPVSIKKNIKKIIR